MARTPTVLQMEAVECGAAALGIILGYHGRHVPLAELREACGVSRDGSNAANVVKAARRYGLEARGLSLSLDEVQRLRAPFVVFWNFNHFLVVEGFGRDCANINDPASGRSRIEMEAFDRGFTGVVLQMSPTEGFVRAGRRPSSLKALARRLSQSRRDLAFCVVAGLLRVVPALAVPMLTKLFIDRVLIEHRQDWLRPLLLTIATLGALHLLLQAMQLRYLRELRTKLAIRLSGRFVWHVLRLPTAFFAQRFTGELSSRVALNDGIAGAVSGQLAHAFVDGLMILFYLAIMIVYDWQLTAWGVLLSLGNVVALRWILRRRVDANLRLRQEQGKVSGVSIAGLQSIETLKASALESSFFSRWSGYYTKTALARQDLGASNQTLALLPPLLASLTTAGILILGGLKVMHGELTIGTLVAFQSLMWMFQSPVGTLVNLGGSLQTLQGDIDRVDDVEQHDIDPEYEERSIRLEPTYPKLSGALEVRGLSFGYSRVAGPLIENFNLRLEAGQRVALVGGSGSGKSTLARLICGLYTPWEGEVLFDGLPRQSLPREVLAETLAWVDQELLFFNGSVRDNLTLWDPSIENERLEAACRDAEISQAIRALEGGLEAALLEGASNFSGGQRQRLEIARALVRDPNLIVLDEATSALDAETEYRLDRNLRRRGCTTIVVAHRLSTIRDADEIIVLEAGKVVERGRHAALWQRGGIYRDLIRSEGGAL